MTEEELRGLAVIALIERAGGEVVITRQEIERLFRPGRADGWSVYTARKGDAIHFTSVPEPKGRPGR